MKYYLGIDGGGTKTHAVVIDSDFNVVYEKKFEGTYIITAGEEKFSSIMETIYKEAMDITNNSIEFIFCALAGYGEFKRDNTTIEQLLSKAYKNTPFKVLNDSVGVWAGGLLCEDGIGVIAGTGSCCCSISKGKFTRIGGWGYLAGDEASAYWIALRAVNSYMKMLDGRRSETILKSEIDKAFDLNDEDNIMNLIYRKMDAQRPEIAQIAIVCSKAAEKGCEVSKQILHDAASEIFDHINTMATKMNTNTMIPVTYTGGVFNSTTFKNELLNLMNNSTNSFTLKEPITNAGIGSALYAYILAGNTITEKEREVITNSFN